MLRPDPTSTLLRLAVRIACCAVILNLCGGIRAGAQTVAATSVLPANRVEQALKEPVAVRPFEKTAAAAWNLLADEMESNKTAHRVNAVSALALIGPRRDIVPLLQDALRDKDAVVRKAAAEALGSMPALGAKGSLRTCLQDESPDVAFAAAHALWKMGDRSGRGLLIDTLDGKSKGGGVKSSVKEKLNEYRDPKRLAVTGVKEAAGAFAGPLPMGFTIAHELLKDRTASARAASAELLGKDPSPAAVEQLSVARFDKNWAVRASAAQALAVSPGKVSVTALEPMLEDDNAGVRATAAAGIIRRSGAPRPPALQWPEDKIENAQDARR